MIANFLPLMASFMPIVQPVLVPYFLLLFVCSIPFLIVRCLFHV